MTLMPNPLLGQGSAPGRPPTSSAEQGPGSGQGTAGTPFLHLAGLQKKACSGLFNPRWQGKPTPVGVPGIVTGKVKGESTGPLFSPGWSRSWCPAGGAGRMVPPATSSPASGGGSCSRDLNPEPSRCSERPQPGAGTRTGEVRSALPPPSCSQHASGGGGGSRTPLPCRCRLRKGRGPLPAFGQGLRGFGGFKISRVGST